MGGGSERTRVAKGGGAAGATRTRQKQAADAKEKEPARHAPLSPAPRRETASPRCCSAGRQEWVGGWVRGGWGGDRGVGEGGLGGDRGVGEGGLGGGQGGGRARPRRARQRLPRRRPAPTPHLPTHIDTQVLLLTSVPMYTVVSSLLARSAGDKGPSPPSPPSPPPPPYCPTLAASAAARASPAATASHTMPHMHPTIAATEDESAPPDRGSRKPLAPERLR